MVKIIVEINEAGTEIKVYCSQSADIEVIDFSQMIANDGTSESRAAQDRYEAQKHLDHATTGMVRVYP